ncbi:MAG TPA: hypothetical protein VI434_13925 [Candidatus Dormibacteraeota bacterium]
MRRVILTLMLVAVLFSAARLTLGTPDVLQALNFFGGGIPTQEAGEAVMTCLAWVVILVAASGLLVGVTQIVGQAQLLRRPAARAAMLLAASLVLLVVGAVHRSMPPKSVCCGSNAADMSEAIHLAQ